MCVFIESRSFTDQLKEKCNYNIFERNVIIVNEDVYAATIIYNDEHVYADNQKKCKHIHQF